MGIRLDELARRHELRLVGDGSVEIDGVCTLANGRGGAISFLANPQYRRYLDETRAAAVIVAEADAQGLAIPALIAADPYLAYARVAAEFVPDGGVTAGAAPGAAIDASAVLADDVAVAAGASIGAGARIGSGARIGPNAVIGSGCVIGDDTSIGANATLEQGVTLGARCTVHPGAVIGSRGFGLAMDSGRWIEVPQLGSVVIGNDVEIGANTTIDRGAVEDTVIGDGVKIDNQVQIAHNVTIGAHTAIAAKVGIAGSTSIGAYCMLGGAVGVAGHIEITDKVIITGMTLVSRSIKEPGTYSSGWPVTTNGEWRKQVARLRRLGKLEDRVRQLESGE